jgi:hypothetical protein
MSRRRGARGRRDREHRNGYHRRKREYVATALAGVVAGEALRRGIEWYRANKRSVDPERGITLRHDADKDYVTIHHLLPDSSSPRWLITTRRRYLPGHWFHKRSIEIIDKAEESGRGRAIYCLDLTRGAGEVIAALSYHIGWNKDEPLLITAIAYRKDQSEMLGESLLGLWLSKRYVHALARKLGRKTYVDFSTNTAGLEPLLARIGLTPCKPLPSNRRHYYFRQQDE